ncbi:MAG: DMT family transporter [Candidatus Hodarchaeales archaeon]|jgi:drug/metabolite transporter (DMT)-like permease
MDRYHIALLVSVLLWATTFAATKLSLAEIPPVSLALLRFLIASVILVTVIGVKKENKKFVKAFKKDSPYFIVLGLVGIALMYIFENFAIKFTTTSQAAIIMNTDPIIIVVLSYFFIKEKLDSNKIIGIIIGFFGVSLVVFNQGDLNAILSSDYFLGNMLALFSSFTWAAYTVMIKNKVEEYGSLVVTTISSIFGVVFLLFSTLLIEGFPDIFAFSLNSWLLVLYLGIVISGISFYLWNYSLKHLDASKVGFYWFLVPVIAIIIGIIFFNEKLNLLMIIGTILIFFGVYLVEKGIGGVNEESTDLIMDL